MAEPQHSGKGCLPWLLVLGLAIVFVIAFPAVKTEAVYMRAYVNFYEERRLAAVQGDINQAAESLKSVAEHEPRKVSANGDLGKALKIVRQGAIREIITRMRTLSGEDLGDDPRPWISNYCRADKRLTSGSEPQVGRSDGIPNAEASKEPYRFVLIMDPHTWEEANWTCQAMGGQLAWFKDRKELERLKELSRGDDTLQAWVGGSRTLTPLGNWTWPDGSRVPAEMVSLISSQDLPGRSILCVTLSTAALTADSGGTNKRVFVCKLPRGAGGGP